tara:strand:- start:365 stop:805 length:441 start_codon:yes stop_codon:yes gene_type:complete
MGFDLFGIKPKQNTKKPSLLKKDFFDIHNDLREEYRNLETEYENNNKGIYFRNNNWWWRPLWIYVYDNCKDILTEKDYESGHYNDGHKISNTKAKRIATRLTKLDKEQVKDVNYYAINDESQYFYKRENVLNFIKFCEESGGFTIC